MIENMIVVVVVRSIS